MNDTFIHSTAEEHMDDLMDLFKVLRKYSLKLSPHKCQFFKKIVYMGLEFQIQGDKVCYTPLKDKCDAIRNLESPKTLRQTSAFCGIVNFLSSFLPNLWRLLIPIYDLQKKAKKFKWMDEAEKAFNEIKKLLVSLPVLKAPTPDGFLACLVFYQMSLCNHDLSVVHSCCPASASVHSPPSHRIQDRNFIFSMNMHMCPQYMHIKYLVILTCSF